MQVVWTAGDRSILLWCAYSGAYLGALISREVDPSLELDTPGHNSEREERKLFIDPSKVQKISVQSVVANSWSVTGQHLYTSALSPPASF